MDKQTTGTGKTGTATTTPSLDGAGLTLRGLVTGKDVVEGNTRDGTKYHMAKLTLTDGKKAYEYSVDVIKNGMPQVELFETIVVNVDYAKTDAGRISVRGGYRNV